MNAFTIHTPVELYAHAMAIERDAVNRYVGLAQHMDAQGNDEVAALFRQLAVFESEQLRTLDARVCGVALPRAADALPGDGLPETVTPQSAPGLITPRHALGIALEAEFRARAFFTDVRTRATDPALRALAQEMAAEEERHIALVEHALLGDDCA
ncbi:MAG: ferritin-like domain-containing protein [Burkholderiales bacterium]